MLKIDNLSKSYGHRAVLQHLSLAIAPSEIYGLLGPNGAGKTTTINLICNLLNADSGTIAIAHAPPNERTKRLIGVLPQETLLYRHLTCQENLTFFARLYGLRGQPLRQQVHQSLAAVGLSDRAQSLAHTLSGGLQRRLSLAIALVHQPQLLILDEPTTGLDIEARFALWELIRTLKQQGLTILLTTHLLDEAERLCDRIGLLKQGHIQAEGTLAELRQLIPAQEIALIQTPDPAAAIARAQTLGWPHRYYGQDLALWLPTAMDLRQIITQFDPIPLESVSRQPIRLEHIYLEVMQQTTAK